MLETVPPPRQRTIVVHVYDLPATRAGKAAAWHAELHMQSLLGIISFHVPTRTGAVIKNCSRLYFAKGVAI